jgi:hypothetical protein
MKQLNDDKIVTYGTMGMDLLKHDNRTCLYRIIMMYLKTKYNLGSRKANLIAYGLMEEYTLDFVYKYENNNKGE